MLTTQATAVNGPRPRC